MLRFWRKTTNPSGGIGETTSVRIETEGRGRIAEISASARRVPWLFNLLQLLWVAGPVTFVAMQSAYWLGFGQLAPARNVVYFIFFTLFLGVIGLGSKFVSVTVFERRAQAAADRLRRTIDWLPDLLFAIRDAELAHETQEQRRRLAAGALLQDLDLGPESLALAVRELCGDSGLAQIAQQIEVYRRLGLYSRVRDLVDQSVEARLAALERVHLEAPELADVLRERLLGRVPSPDQGVARREGFLQRLLAAADQDNPETLPLVDIQELIVLLFELVNGREIRYLYFTWRGRWNVTRVLTAVEVARTRYRLAQLRVDSRMRGLGMLLVATEGSGLQRGDTDVSTTVLSQRVLGSLRRLVTARPARGSKAAQRLNLLLQEVQQLREDHARWVQTAQEFDQALLRWEQVQAYAQQPIPTEGLKAWWSRWRGRGVHIQEDVITWTNDQKLAFAAGFCRLIEQFGLEWDERGLSIGGQSMDRGEIQRFGLALLSLLQDSLDLSDLAIQRAIQAAPAAWLGGLQTGMTADARAGLGAAVVKDVQQDLGRMAERLAAQLATLYQIPLDPPVCAHLVERYGANPERLQVLASRATEGTLLSPLQRPQVLEREAILNDPRWDRLLSRGGRYME